MHWVVIPFILLSAYSWPNPSANLTGTWAPSPGQDCYRNSQVLDSPRGQGDRLMLSVGTSCPPCLTQGDSGEWKAAERTWGNIFLKHWIFVNLWFFINMQIAQSHGQELLAAFNTDGKKKLFPHVTMKKTSTLYKSCLLIVASGHSTWLLRKPKGPIWRWSLRTMCASSGFETNAPLSYCHRRAFLLHILSLLFLLLFLSLFFLFFSPPITNLSIVFASLSAQVLTLTIIKASSYFPVVVSAHSENLESIKGRNKKRI